MIWLVQHNTFDEPNYGGFIKALRSAGQTFHQLSYIMFEHTIDIRVEQYAPNNLLPIGSINLVQFGLLHGWRAYYNHVGFQYLTCAIGYGKWFLNSDLELRPLKDLKLDGSKFVRQNDGLNLIKGCLMHPQDWDICAGWDRKTDGYTTINQETLMVTARPKEILAEYRVFVIGGAPVSSSQYRLNGELNERNTDDDVEIMTFAQQMVECWRPNDTFVLDLARTPDGLFVLEANCFNCAGWYQADPYKIVDAICKLEN